MGSNLAELRNELDILRCLDHPNIIKLHAVYEDQKRIHIITDLCKGGDMVDAIISRYGYSEEEAAQINNETTSYCRCQDGYYGYDCSLTFTVG